MREKLPLTNGIAGLALAASIFLGCQDFLGEDKAGQTAKPPAEEAQVAAQQASTQDVAQDAPGTAACAGVAKDLPATGADTTKPAKSEPVPTPAISGDLAECQAIYDQMQTAKEPLYGELKNRFSSLNCDHSKFTVPVVPYVPPDSATVCKNLRSTLTLIEPGSPKYVSYQQEIAIYCTDGNSPAEPIKTASTPEPYDPVPACKNLYSELLGAKEPAYGELRLKFTNMTCDDILGVTVPETAPPQQPPPPPPDSATLCNNIRAALPFVDPASPKYPLYLQEIAI